MSKLDKSSSIHISGPIAKQSSESSENEYLPPINDKQNYKQWDEVKTREDQISSSLQLDPYYSAVQNWYKNPLQQPYHIGIDPSVQQYPRAGVPALRPSNPSTNPNILNVDNYLSSMITAMYTLVEKWKFLESIGYKVDSPLKDFPISETLIVTKGEGEEACILGNIFKKEIMHKFKEMLISKGTLKIKI